jgi:chromosomal replication initiation ATPase DnaA
VWQSTFAPAAPVELTADRFILGLPNGIIRDKLDGRYRPLVEDAVSEAAGHELAVHFQLMLPTLFDNDLNINQALDNGRDLDLTAGPLPAHLSSEVAYRGSSAPLGPAPPPPPTNEVDQRNRYTFDGFVIGPRTGSPTPPPCR